MSDRMCATCPFYEKNRGKPNPPSNMGDIEQSEWYSQGNIDGVWDVMRLQEIPILSCHSTDPDYLGKSHEKMMACTGATFLVYMHLKVLEKSESYEDYVKKVGPKVAMKSSAMLMKFLYIRNGIGMGEFNMRVPTEVNCDSDQMRFPTGSEEVLRIFKEIVNKKV